MTARIGSMRSLIQSAVAARVPPARRFSDYPGRLLALSADPDITPDECLGIVRRLGEEGWLNEALEFVQKMPFPSSFTIWENLLHIATLNGDAYVRRRCLKVLQGLDPSRISQQQRMGLLDVRCLQEDDEEIQFVKYRDMKVDVKFWKDAGGVQGKMAGVGEEGHAGQLGHEDEVEAKGMQYDMCHQLLVDLHTEMRSLGYSPITRLIFHDVDVDSKEGALLDHSERMAIASKILTTPPWTPISVGKTSRTCNDCHNALEFMTVITGRRIISSDNAAFRGTTYHIFDNGECSCGRKY